MFSKKGFNSGKHHHHNNMLQDKCVCPKCGYSIAHERGVPCSSKSCPVCNSWLVRQDANQTDSSHDSNIDTTVEKPIIGEKVVNYPKVNPELCIGCGVCVDVCPFNAIVMKDDKAFIIDNMCRNCKKCVRVCSVGAIS